MGVPADLSTLRARPAGSQCGTRPVLPGAPGRLAGPGWVTRSPMIFESHFAAPPAGPGRAMTPHPSAVRRSRRDRRVRSRRSTRSSRTTAPTGARASCSRRCSPTRARRGAASGRGPEHAVRQHDPRRGRSRDPRRPRARAPRPLARALERDRDRPAGQQGVLRARRPHRQLPVRRDALRGRLQPLLARADATSTAATSSSCRATRSPGIYARAFLEGRLTEEQMRSFRTGGRRRRALAPTRTRG